jgi:hypothetical protein
VFQQSDPKTIILTYGIDHQQKFFRKIDPTQKITNNYRRLEHCLQINSNGGIFGNIIVASNTKYSTLKKDHQTRQNLQQFFKITTTLNSNNAKVPTEIGLFVHHLVRYDTIDSTRFLNSVLPGTTPPFQQEMVTIYGLDHKTVARLLVS